VTRITSGFSMRMHPILNSWRAHKGVDYGAPSGAPVRTVGDGQVEFAGTMSGYGNVIEIDHGKGNSTLYAHLSHIDVRKGQRVERGQRIGAVGSTAGRPVRTCTSSSRKTASSATRWKWPAARRPPPS
jgi:murein DD-endopeptidase MepM/ murein hydrolase activator NlpD